MGQAAGMDMETRMRFHIEAIGYPELDWTDRTTAEGPRLSVKTLIVAKWDMAHGFPTTDELLEAVTEMKARFPGQHKDYRIMGLPKPGDSMFGVEFA